MALRLSEWTHFHEINSTPPLLSIDDFGLHLDATRNQLLLSRLSHFGQVFITSPGPTPNNAYFSLKVNKGDITQAPTLSFSNFL